MNFYTFFPSDYLGDTQALTWLEDCAYRRMLDLFYRTEKPLPAHRDALYREVRALTKEQKNAVDYVLSKYWRKAVGRGGGFVQIKANKILKRAQEKRHLAVLAGRQSALARNGRLTANQRPLNYPDPDPDPDSSNHTFSQDQVLGAPEKTNGKISMPQDFVLDEWKISFAKFHHADPQQRWNAFVEWCQSNHKQFSDWNAAYRSFILSGPKLNYRKEKKSAAQKTKEAAARVLARYNSN